jgi:hypothetical protein
VVLSTLDLCTVALPNEQFGCFKKKYAKEVLPRILSYQQIPNYWWRSKSHASLRRAEEARNRFVDCLLWFFTFRHQDDATPEGRKRRDYLRELLSELRKGDVVITLNWDTTIERTLAEDDRWTPMTGYGFEKSLRTGSTHALQELPAEFSRESEVVVLKPHGSFGWHESKSRSICFSNYYFLPQFGFVHRSDPILLFDPASPLDQPDRRPVLAYPSFLKQLRGAEMQKIWYRASEALAQAETIDIWGYSLPESDSAIRTLLNPLRFRLEQGNVRVCVHEPGCGVTGMEVRDRWKQFFGELACIDKKRLGNSPKGDLAH